MGARNQRCAIDAVACLIHRVQESWAEKKLVAALFMDVKGAFDHVSRTRLIEKMMELGIDGDLIHWTQSFLTDRTVQLVIDGHDNRESRIETGIPQGSPVSPILFLIHISGVFEQVTESNPTITSLSFVDDLCFIATGFSVKELAKSLGQVAQVVLDWGKSNVVTYDIAKIEAVLFSKSHRQRINKQIAVVNIEIGTEKIKFNKEATRWLGIWLDSQLKFTAHINEKLLRARTAEIQIKGLTRTYGLAPALVQRIQIAAVQSIALCGAELWWKQQKNHESTVQKLLNRQARAITGMYPSMPVHPLLCEAGLIPAKLLLDFRQKTYAYRLLTLPDHHPTKNILPVSLRKGDESSQSREQPNDTLIWAEQVKPREFGHLLAQKVSSNNAIDPADGVEPVDGMRFTNKFSGTIIIEEEKRAVQEARRYRTGTVMWVDGSKLDQGNAGAAVCWKDKVSNNWKSTAVFLGKNKEILDA